MTTGQPDESTLIPSTPPPHTWRDRVRALVPLLLVGVVLYLVIRLTGDIDWRQVADGLSRLTWWQGLILLLGVLVRQALSAFPLNLFVKGLGQLRAMQNDLVGILLAAVAPAPTDIVVRLAMFKSWGISATQGVAGAVMNAVTYFVIRFGAPLLGIVVIIVTGGPAGLGRVGGSLFLATMGILVSASILVAIWLSVRDERLAAGLGHGAGRVLRRVRRSVDPERWRNAMIDFRKTIAERFGWAFPRALGSQVAMVVVDATLVVLAVRFVGLGPDQVGVTDIAAVFFIAYPLTMFFFQGLGVLDAAAIALIVGLEGIDASIEPELIAAFVVWRVATLLVPMLLGAISWLSWRIANRKTAAT